MSAAQYNLNIARGEDFSFTLRITDPFDTPINLTEGGQQFRAEIREAHKKPLAVALTVTYYNPEDSGVDTGTLLFSLSHTQTLSLDVSKNYLWDFFWTDGGGAVHKLLYGKVKIDANITHV